jgi:hypothetical protein
LAGDEILIVWDGETLAAELATFAGPIRCVIPRETIHAISISNDAVDWEIDRYKMEILHLKQCSGRKSACAAKLSKSALTQPMLRT